MLKNKIIYTLILVLSLSNAYIWPGIITIENNQSDDLEIYFLNVGQGDSILIKTPNNKYVLIDGGIGNQVLDEMQKIIPQNIYSLDLVIFTHPDADHIGGLNHIMKKYIVKNTFVQKVDKDTKVFEESKKLILERKIKNYQVNENNDFYLDGVFFDVLWPIDQTKLYDFDNVNNTSIAFMLSYGDFEFFTAGDLETKYEEEVVSRNNFKDVDLLKLSHQGSKTSTSIEFLKSINPKISVISSGSNNRYGHPSKEVIDNLKHVNTKVLSTAEAGTITISTDGKIIRYLADNKGLQTLIAK